jgi:hypothetical protein
MAGKKISLGMPAAARTCSEHRCSRPWCAEKTATLVHVPTIGRSPCSTPGRSTSRCSSEA